MARVVARRDAGAVTGLGPVKRIPAGAIERIRKLMPTVEVLDEGGARTGIVGRLYNVRDLGGQQVVEVASGGRRIVVRSTLVTEARAELLPAPAKI